MDYQRYSECLAGFFGIEPIAGETIALDGKVLRGSYQLEDDNPYSEPQESNYAGERLHCGARTDFVTLRSCIENQ